jgi:hypothetical protein
MCGRTGEKTKRKIKIQNYKGSRKKYSGEPLDPADHMAVTEKKNGISTRMKTMRLREKTN